MLRTFLMLAAFFGFTGVALGAFAAHGLKNRLTPEYLAIFHTGVLYQLIHTLAIFGVAILATQIQGRLVSYAGIAFVLGILPLAFASGAGMFSQLSLGHTVMWGMLAALLIGTPMIPAFYAIVQSTRESLKRKLLK